MREAAGSVFRMRNMYWLILTTIDIIYSQCLTQTQHAVVYV